jgi:hypothetical protein
MYRDEIIDRLCTLGACYATLGYIRRFHRLTDFRDLLEVARQARQELILHPLDLDWFGRALGIGLGPILMASSAILEDRFAATSETLEGYDVSWGGYDVS